jgi:hypothetical protein
MHSYVLRVITATAGWNAIKSTGFGGTSVHASVSDNLPKV